MSTPDKTVDSESMAWPPEQCCSCIDGLEAIEGWEGQPGDKVLGVLLQEAGIVGNFTTRKSRREVILHLEIRVEGKKRPVKKPLFCSFCPFCGIRLRGE
jgi:hypothetical protein